MTSPSKIRITELDFLKIKENFKTYLQSQSQFQDYNFDGSALNILLDVLALNTGYQGYYLNQLASEMFLDSAILRESVVSRAKHLGYTPRSKVSAKAKVNLTIDPSLGPGDANPASILIPTSQQFSTNIDNKIYYFSPVKSILITPVSGVYSATDVELIEGKRLSFRWTADSNTPLKQRFIIPNSDVDVSQLVVRVQESATNTASKIYTKHQDINELNSESQVYFLQEVAGERFEIYFGDGVIGKKINDGNIVIVEYIVTSGDVVSGAKTFSPVNKLGGYNSYSVRTVESARNAYAEESIESVRLLAPLNYEAQNRAVTKTDYETLIKKDIPSLEYVRVWGGEDNDPPEYGKVFVAAKPFTGLALSEDQKAVLVNTYIRPRNMISVEVVIVEPQYLFIQVQSNVLYNSRETSLSDSDIQNSVTQSILDFASSQLNGFDADFRYSKLVQDIDESDDSIKGNLTNIKLKYRIFPPFNIPTTFDIKLNNSLDKGDSANGQSSLSSSGFIYRGILTYVGDDGKGSLYLYRIVNDQKVIIQSGIGTIDYGTGRIILNAFEVQSIPNNQDYVDFFILPLKNDVIAEREQILLLEEEDIIVTVEDLALKI